jgi:hypothetical protein
MATAAQITANRENAQHSTGPVTPEGKSRVAQNALKHGLTAKNLVIRIDEREEFAELRDSLHAELAPQGAVETLTFNEILHAAWNLHRFRRIEAEICSGFAGDFTDPETTAVLDRLTRYQARAQRAYFRALAELRTLQTNRALRAFKVDPDDLPEVPAIADINELTKQTHSEVQAEAMKLAREMFDLQYATDRAHIHNIAKGEFASIAR